MSSFRSVRALVGAGVVAVAFAGSVAADHYFAGPRDSTNQPAAITNPDVVAFGDVSRFG